MARAEKIFDQEYTGRDFNTSPVTVSGLEGDTYDYHILFITSYGLGDTASSDFWLQFNSDTTSNYAYYMIKGDAATDSFDADISHTALHFLTTPGNTFGMDSTKYFSKLTISGSSGDVRNVIGQSAGGNGTGTGNNQSLVNGGYWFNTADELTSITIGTEDADTYDARIVIYRTPKGVNKSQWQLIEKQTVSASDINSTPINFTLDGDNDIEYRVTGAIDFAASEIITATFNSDSGTNYNYCGLSGNVGGGMVDRLSSGDTSWQITSSTATDGRFDLDITIHADSGVDRLARCTWVNDDSTGREMGSSMCSWQNTASNLTDFDISTTTASSATGTLYLWRRKNPNTIGDDLNFMQIHNKALSSTDYSAGETITVAGDTITLIKIEGLLANTTGDIELRMQINSDTSANYEEQTVYTDNSTVAASEADTTYFILCRLQNANQSAFTAYLYPRDDGLTRPMISRQDFDDNAIYHVAHHWNNIVDEITSLKIYASSTDGITGGIKVSRLNI